MRELFATAWPGESFDRVAVAFDEFDKLFTGRMPGYHGVDTVYHDRQHSLDMTLAMARLLVGYERTVERRQRFGAERAIMALVTSLFHDAGYIREFDDRQHRNGAEFTLYHVTRSARFLARFLPSIGMETWVPVSTRIVHFTGYEIKLEPDPARRQPRSKVRTPARHRGSDRADGRPLLPREVPRPALPGIRARRHRRGPAVATARMQVRYSSGLDLLRQTPEFVRETRAGRLDGEFEHAYRYVEPLFGGKNPYLEAIDRNVEYLQRILRAERWRMLRRNPPLFTSERNQLGQVRGLMVNRLKALWA